MSKLSPLGAPLLAALAVLPGCANANATSSETADALLMALEDEYRAEATYAAILDKFGDIRPFSNVINAERRHAQRAIAELDRLGIAYDAQNPFTGTIAAPDTVLEACEAAVQAEIDNIALYDRLLPTIEDDEVRATLEDLQWASRERHLPAFQRCVDRGGAMGAGREMGHGKGRSMGRGMGGGMGRDN